MIARHAARVPDDRKSCARARVRRVSLGTWSSVGETSITAHRARIHADRVHAREASNAPSGPCRRGRPNARGHGVVNGAESDGLGVFASFDGRLETEGLLQALHLTDDVFSTREITRRWRRLDRCDRAVQVVGRLRRRS